MTKIKLGNFIKTTSKTTFVKAGGMAIGVLVSISLGRILGSEGLGIINLSNQISGLLSMLVLLGLPSVILKETAISVNKKNWGHIRNVIVTSLKINVPLAVLVTLLSYSFIPFIVTHFFEDSLELPLKIITTVIIFKVISRIFGASLNGYHKIWQSSLVGNTLSILIVSILILVQYLLKWQITVITVAFSYAIARIIVSIIISLYWKEVHHKAENISKAFIPITLLKVGLPLLFVQATNTIANSIDSIMIGSFLSMKDVGLYAVAFRIAFVSSFFLQVTNAVLAPKVATMFANNEIDKLERMVQKVTGVLILIGIVGLLVVIFGGKFMLSLWGQEFSEAYYPLIILSIGQLFNIGAGAVGLILILCNEEKNWGYVTLGSAIFNTVLNFVFIQYLGIGGAALATSINMIAINIIGVIIIKKKIGIVTIPYIRKI
jgi:O-antigen/teichoic acid export membrane protein